MSLGARPNARSLSVLYSALEYTDQARLDHTLGYTTIQATAKPNLDANRYRDILAYDHALLPGAYLNAAYIPPFHPTSLSFIVSQAPLPHTYTAFYTHLVQQRVRVLVNLTPLVEKGRTKAHQYWPDASSSDTPAGPMMLDNGWCVEADAPTCMQLEGGNAVLERRLLHIRPADPAAQAEAGLDSNGWRVTQFHLSSWPDHGVFPTTMLLELMDKIQHVPMPKIYPPPPTWIHCSAGVGRSGTLAAALIAQTTINIARPSLAASDAEQAGALPMAMRAQADAMVWDLPVRIVEHLRRYRARMVQTIDQFQALYDIVHHLATPPTPPAS